MINIAVFASGKGSNFAALVQAARKGKFRARLALLVCDNPGALVLDKARKAGIKVALVQSSDFPSKNDFEERIMQELEDNKIGLILLAGFMRMLSPAFVKKYQGRIINIHPSLLPSFKGAHAIADAFWYGVQITGVTVHFVDEKMDHGPIILQAAVKREPCDTLESLEARIHSAEHRLYPEAVRLFVEGKLKKEGRLVVVKI